MSNQKSVRLDNMDAKQQDENTTQLIPDVLDTDYIMSRIFQDLKLYIKCKSSDVTINEVVVTIKEKHDDGKNTSVTIHEKSPFKHQ